MTPAFTQQEQVSAYKLERLYWEHTHIHIGYFHVPHDFTQLFTRGWLIFECLLLEEQNVSMADSEAKHRMMINDFCMVYFDPLSIILAIFSILIEN